MERRCQRQSLAPVGRRVRGEPHAERKGHLVMVSGVLDGLPWWPAQHYGHRHGMAVVGSVIHYTAGGAGRATARWAQQIPQSWHFLICRDGYTIQQVALDRAAYHAEPAEWGYQGETRFEVNRFTIGIELANWGPLEKDGSGFRTCLGTKYRGVEPSQATLSYGGRSVPDVTGFWEPYPDQQLYALDGLLDRLWAGEGIPRSLVGHEEVAMPLGRKMDPGPVFPWHRFGRGPFDRRTSGVPSAYDLLS